MPAERGVYPGQWGLPGGGIEDGETMDGALRREAHEELGIHLATATPLLFKDAVREKRYPDGRREELYMVFLVFDCPVTEVTIQLNDEFDAVAWVGPTDLERYDLNEETVDTFRKIGILPTSSTHTSPPGSEI
jgi:nucleoside triphosphatase